MSPQMRKNLKPGLPIKRPIAVPMVPIACSPHGSDRLRILPTRDGGKHTSFGRDIRQIAANFRAPALHSD